MEARDGHGGRRAWLRRRPWLGEARGGYGAPDAIYHAEKVEREDRRMLIVVG